MNMDIKSFKKYVNQTSEIMRKCGDVFHNVHFYSDEVALQGKYAPQIAERLLKLGFRYTRTHFSDDEKHYFKWYVKDNIRITLTGEMNECGFNFFVIRDDVGKAYDVPAGDASLTDVNVAVLGGFYSGDVAFATAQAINEGLVKISEL